MPRPRVGISRCLLGDGVRYDGGHKRDALLLDTLGRHVEWVPVCPEVEVGMSTPREPIHLVAAHDGVRMIGVCSGRDWTEAMDRWARDKIRELVGAAVSGYVLKQDSPSCGMDGVRVQSDAGVERTGRGLFAQALVDTLPGLPIEEEGRLRDRGVRENFLERVFAYHLDLCHGP